MEMNRLPRKISSALLLIALLVSSTARALAAAPDRKDADSASRILSWEVTGPLGGDVRSLVVDPADAQRLYLGTIDGQIYTTNDGGENWTRLEGFNRPGLLIDNIIIDPRDSKVLYVAGQRHKDLSEDVEDGDEGCGESYSFDDLH